MNRMIKFLSSKQKLAQSFGQKNLVSSTYLRCYSTNDLNIKSDKITVQNSNINKPTIGRTVGKILK